MTGLSCDTPNLFYVISVIYVVTAVSRLSEAVLVLLVACISIFHYERACPFYASKA